MRSEPLTGSGLQNPAARRRGFCLAQWPASRWNKNPALNVADDALPAAEFLRRKI
jgi:hypothetical protein